MSAEMALLGSILKENYLIRDTKVKPNHIEDVRHQALLKEMRSLNQGGNSLDIITLSTMVDLEPFGGISYLNDLLSYANAEKFDDYESLILDKWKEREKRNILTRANEEDWEIGKIISSLDDINEVKTDDYTSISEALAEVFEAPWQEQAIKKGAPTGLSQMDRMTNGFQDGEVTIIAARPSMGKSDVMLHFAKQTGWRGYLPILFSLEMPYKSLVDRLIASTGEINRMKLRNPYRFLDQKQKDNWGKVIGLVDRTNIQIFDGAGQTVSEMRAKARKAMHQHTDKKPIIIIDYMTLVRPEEFYGGNAHLQVTEISRNLKGMAKEFNCHVICLAQLSRAVEQRADKRPMMSDIRESGSVEQDADVIMFLYREKYYDKTSSNDQLEIIVAKNRNGPVGTVYTTYNEFTGEISDVNDQRVV